MCTTGHEITREHPQRGIGVCVGAGASTKAPPLQERQTRATNPKAVCFDCVGELLAFFIAKHIHKTYGQRRKRIHWLPACNSGSCGTSTAQPFHLTTSDSLSTEALCISQYQHQKLLRQTHIRRAYNYNNNVHLVHISFHLT